MKNKFNKQIAKSIAEHQFDWTLDCIIGIQDPDYNLESDLDDFEQNFSEDLEQMNIAVTPTRIGIINEYYKKLVVNAKNKIEKLYSKKTNK